MAAVPLDKPIVLGLVTTKTGRQETVDELETRIREAAHQVPLEGAVDDLPELIDRAVQVESPPSDLDVGLIHELPIPWNVHGRAAAMNSDVNRCTHQNTVTQLGLIEEVISDGAWLGSPEV